MKLYSKEELISFEDSIASLFNAAKIRAPVHLSNGNEDEMIKIFKENEIRKEDWVFCTWRSHYQSLLKGVPIEKLRDDIVAGKSITLCYPEYNIFSSAIVAGIIPIAVGLAASIKYNKNNGLKDNRRVFCFIGEMTSETGTFYENFKYATTNEFPIKFIIEDNLKSVCTDTRKTWYNSSNSLLEFEKMHNSGLYSNYLYYYKYQSRWPHAGAGKRIQF